MRPEFRQLLADLANGVIDGVTFYDLDRLVRQPRDLEDLIHIIEYVKHPVTDATTGGRMNLINDSDRHMARMMCVMPLKSSEDTARRVARHLREGSNASVGTTWGGTEAPRVPAAGTEPGAEVPAGRIRVVRGVHQIPYEALLGEGTFEAVVAEVASNGPGGSPGRVEVPDVVAQASTPDCLLHKLSVPGVPRYTGILVHNHAENSNVWSIL